MAVALIITTLLYKRIYIENVYFFYKKIEYIYYDTIICLFKMDPIKAAIDAFVITQNNILESDHSTRKQQALLFNKAIVSIRARKITIDKYITLFRNQVFPDLNIAHILYLLQLHQNHTLIDADDLGPRRFNVLSLEGRNNNLTSEQLENLFKRCGLIKREDYYKGSIFRTDISSAGYVLNPSAFKTCLTCSKKIGHKYMTYYFFLEIFMDAYNDYQNRYDIIDKINEIRRIKEHKTRVFANVATLKEQDNEIIL